MTIRAWLREGARDERMPREARLQVLLEATGVSGEGEAVPISVHNISATGMLLECSEPIAVDESLAINLPGAPGTMASVVWASANFYGCRFERRLGKATLSAAQLQSAVGAEGIAASHGATPPSESLDMRLQRLRKARGLSLAELAEALGVSKPTVWAWEQARSSPSPDRYDKIAEVLGTSVSALSSGRDEGLAAGILDRSRRQIAQAWGVDVESVRIMIEL